MTVKSVFREHPGLSWTRVGMLIAAAVACAITIPIVQYRRHK
jgi:hypothetical protein